ncbi:hypothetical protein Desaci_4702 [Desulfosporosinus acidiphilus SJ4]|uniref:Uncharacterized protein n=1 Tax=Desulfosporosinus acidiphilus (strain DSM 22704 / JCM 16185 / SJ4) TaxID=646529 RepID=I4DCK6_DESAJ|nr:hypothetical protein [Desulfosporosinus acidiphilus]AFM43530.1 hypothetical protein Desaci_4702 [Desulfosporosinus acidiphilus SJ4]
MEKRKPKPSANPVLKDVTLLFGLLFFLVLLAAVIPALKFICEVLIILTLLWFLGVTIFRIIKFIIRLINGV